MYSVAKISEKLGVSKVTVYNDLKRFKVQLNPYITTSKRSKCLNDEGFEMLKNLRSNKADFKPDFKLDFKPNFSKEIEIELRQRLEDSKERIKSLESQLERSQKNFEREQQLHEHTQILLKQTQDKLLLSDGNENGDLFKSKEMDPEKEKKSFWKKIFG